MDRTCRVGLHGRNDADFQEADFRVITEAKIETVKMVSLTRVEHFQRLKQLRPDVEIITRLADDRFGNRRRPTPEQFAERAIPVMRQLQPYSVKFELHNEPNHMDGLEGWGDTDADAQDFNAWFLRAAAILKAYCPWARLGFPGLAIPHRDLEWVEACRPAVTQADWLGVHCYWQTPGHEMHNHLSDFWGLRFKYYHQKFPGKIIDITEAGNANGQTGLPFTEETQAREYTEYLTECFRYPFLNSVSFFIVAASNPGWQSFTWRAEDGRPHKVVWAVRDMLRPHYRPAQQMPAQPAPTATPAPQVAVAAPLVQNIIAQLPSNPAQPWPQRPLNQVDRIIVHHSAVASTVSANRLAEIMVNQHQRPGLSYHYFITADGLIQQTNELTAVTLHSAPELNMVSIGVGFAGNFTQTAPTPAQLEAGARLMAWLVQQFRLPPQAVYGHKELANTTSPGAQWDAGARWGDQLRQKIAAYLTGAAQ